MSEYVRCAPSSTCADLSVHGRFQPRLIAFDELASLKDDYAEIKAFGLAGKCGTLTLMERYADSAEVNAELWNYRNDLRDGEMEQLLRVATERNRKNWGPPRARSGTTGSKNISNQTQNTPN